MKQLKYPAAKRRRILKFISPLSDALLEMSKRIHLLSNTQLRNLLATDGMLTNTNCEWDDYAVWWVVKKAAMEEMQWRINTNRMKPPAKCPTPNETCINPAACSKSGYCIRCD
jgi:hypothetical protein